MWAFETKRFAVRLCDLHCLTGWFISKVFRSKDYTALMWVFNQFFNKVEATKPKASRQEIFYWIGSNCYCRHTSAEIYVVCQDYKAPKEIDSKLFDPHFVFEEVSEKKKVDLSYKFLKKKVNQSGYDDELAGNVIFKSCPVSKFIDCDNPVQVAAEHNVFTWDDDEASKKFAKLFKQIADIKLDILNIQIPLQKLKHYVKIYKEWEE